MQNDANLEYNKLLNGNIKSIFFFPDNISLKKIFMLCDVLDSINASRNNVIKGIFVGGNKKSVRLSARLCGFSYAEIRNDTELGCMALESEVIFSNKSVNIRCYGETSLTVIRQILIFEEAGLIVANKDYSSAFGIPQISIDSFLSINRGIQNCH